MDIAASLKAFVGRSGAEQQGLTLRDAAIAHVLYEAEQEGRILFQNDVARVFDGLDWVGKIPLGVEQRGRGAGRMLHGKSRPSKGPFQDTLLLLVDVQQGFGAEAQSVALRGLRTSESQEVQAAAKLIEAVYRGGGLVVGTQDLHNDLGTQLPDGRIDNRSAEEFGIYGAHCVPGSGDEEFNPPVEAAFERIERSEGQDRTQIGVDEYDPSRPGLSRLVEVHKNYYDVAQRVVILPDGSSARVANQPFLDLVARAREQGITRIAVGGKIAEVCVRAAVLSLRHAFPGLEIVLLEDTISSMPPGQAKKLGYSTKEEVLQELSSKPKVKIAQSSAWLAAAEDSGEAVSQG